MSGGRLYLGTINVLHLKAYIPFSLQQAHYIVEKLLDMTFQPFATEVVDGAKVTRTVPESHIK